MGLVLAIAVAALTVVVVLFILFADGMSDAPSQNGISIWPAAIIGFGIAAALAITHFVHFTW